MAKPEPSILEQIDEIDPEADARRLAAAEADIAAGRLISNADMIAWLETWGTPEEATTPASWLN